MNNNIIPIEAIRERDIDLLLVEELTVNDEFSKWFVKENNFPKLAQNNGAWRSISDYGLGETDILFSYYSESDKKIFILIENKLDAEFQNQQYERYIKRAQKYVADKKCDESYVILVAPNQYCINQSDFEIYTDYETISDYFYQSASKRAKFKSDLLKIASEKLRRGYQAVNSVPVQRFWLKYWQYKNEHFPQLIMKKPGIVPFNSDWPMLFDNVLKGIVLYHKLSSGHIDATFKGFNNEVKAKLMQKLPENAKFIEHNIDFSIRLITDKCDRTNDFDSQREKINKGLTKMEFLRQWLIANRKIFK